MKVEKFMKEIHGGIWTFRAPDNSTDIVVDGDELEVITQTVDYKFNTLEELLECKTPWGTTVGYEIEKLDDFFKPHISVTERA